MSGRAHSLPVKECYLPGKPWNCLPRRAHSLPVRECYLPGMPGSCLPANCLHGRAHSLPVKECYLLGKPGDCLPGRSHSLPVRECYLLGRPGNCLPGGAHSLLVRENYLPGKPGNCLPGRKGSEEELFLLGKAERPEGKQLRVNMPAWMLLPAWMLSPAWTLLPACLLFTWGKALVTRGTWELSQVILPSFLFIRLLMLPNESMCINCRFHMELCQTYRVCNYAFCIVFEWYFVLIFCLCFMYKLNIFHPLWDQYADSIVKPPCICACLVLCLNLTSLILVNYLSYFVSTLCSHLCQSYLWQALNYYK